MEAEVGFFPKQSMMHKMIVLFLGNKGEGGKTISRDEGRRQKKCSLSGIDGKMSTFFCS